MAHLTQALVENPGVGVCPSDFAQHRFNKLRQPPYALHPMAKPSDRRETWRLARGDSLLCSKSAFSVWVSGNWRMTFRFDGTDALLVDYQDYH